MEAEKRGQRRRVTAADVAARAHVSSTTVGYVLNGTKGQTISPATTRRVLDAARELQYQPHRSAQTLARGTSDVVLVVLPDWPSSESFSAAVESASAFLADAGLSCVTQVIPPTYHRAVWRSIDPLLVAGVVPFTDEEIQDMHSAGVSHIMTLMSAERGDSGALQAEHLVGLGHQRLGFAASADQRMAAVSQSRVEAFTDAATRLGAPAPLVRTVSLFDDSAARALEDWRSAGVTAVAGFTDEVAAAVLRAMHAQGLSAPDDMAVIGHDDTSLARLFTPQLSSVAVDAAAYGRHMASLVLATIRGEQHPAPGEALFTLIARESTTAMPGTPSGT
ncbi:MAG TPA: LacI family DNA-binding transcriptional regulator [Microbacterium sp.]|uniref:LacI family DNA-binding transcriptional regulator n=1 Tax=Microbacterium sp. TaxID=51671 RepID=UPI002BF8D49D|nr:LacI family DNA-binding transcriptional regulator [Microbacterium sp.]HWI30550.1 LacI family DNA-binding transcriptional regulator [Microbacterium sp.]